MSVKVDLGMLAETMSDYAFAYLLTVSDDQRPHAVAVRPELRDGMLLLGEVGGRTRANLAARPDVTVLFPPREPGGYSLIVDGRASAAGAPASVAPAHAVLHRPADHATPPSGSACGNDCIPVSPA